MAGDAFEHDPFVGFEPPQAPLHGDDWSGSETSEAAEAPAPVEGNE